MRVSDWSVDVCSSDLRRSHRWWRSGFAATGENGGFRPITAVAPAKAGAAVVLRSGAGISLQRPPPSRGRRVMQYPLTTPNRPLEPFVSNDAFKSRATFVSYRIGG